MRNRICHLEIAVRAGPAGMHDSLRDSFMIEMGDLLAEMEVLEQ